MKKLIGLIAATLVMHGTARAEGVRFGRAFAPQEGLVSRYEAAARQELCLNGSWQFQGTADTSVPGETPTGVGEWEATAIKIPSPWNVNGFSMDDGAPGGDFRAYPSYPKEWEKVKAAWMQKTVAIPADWKEKRVVLRFGAVAGKLVVFVNGKRAGEGFDIFFAQEFDVTELVRVGAENQILVKVVRAKEFDKEGKYGRREYLAGSFWGSYIAGIWQDVFLEARPEVYVNDVFVQPWVDRDELVVEATLVNEGKEAVDLEISGKAQEWVNQAGKTILELPEVRWKLADGMALQLPGATMVVQPGETRKIRLSAKVDGKLKLWSPEQPNLYGLLLTVAVKGKPVDVKYQRFGWRQFTMQQEKLLLNGEPITLRGDSWHFMGVPQMTRRYAAGWYQLLKDANANAVRLHASVYPEFYHDLADEMGIVILDETAIWLSDGGPKADSELFWANCREHVEKLVRRDRNHPSVVGWSVCNESLAVLRGVWHAPKEMVDRGLAEIGAWVGICRTNDPTRAWISGDGEGDAEGRLPVINIHYGGEEESRRASKSGKPWGVGETSMAYYGSPKQVSKFNGNRAYESALGRMEGLAYECYGLLRSQQEFGAAYQSIFNIAWYGVQPLPLGKAEVTRPITLDEGIFFGKHQEGIPGMQPERLGPYTTTLNPGYDAALPLYRTWPMFDAVRDANLGVTNSGWANPPGSAAAEVVTPLGKTNATVGYVKENGSRLSDEFQKAGVKAAAVSEGVAVEVLLVDGSVVQNQSQDATLQGAVDQVLAQGGTVWVWDVKPAGAGALSKLLGQEVVVEPRTASSFVVKQSDPLVAGLDNASLYFSEGDKWQQMTYGLGGAFVKGAQVVVEACPVEWRQWNYKGEPVKTAALYRSGVENTGALAAVVVRPLRQGRVILCNLSPEINSVKQREVVDRLFRNAGVAIDSLALENSFLDGSGRLVRSLVCGAFPFAEVVQAYSNRPPAGPIKAGGEVEGRKWTLRNTDFDGVFDFRNGLVEGPQDNAFAYLAVWIKSPKPLNDLLSEPNLPKLSFTYGSDDGCQLWLNGELLATQERVGPLDPNAFLQNPLLLKLGWNQLVIKVVQVSGGWTFAGKFGCADLTFLQKLEFATERPGE